MQVKVQYMEETKAPLLLCSRVLIFYAVLSGYLIFIKFSWLESGFTNTYFTPQPIALAAASLKAANLA